MTGSSNFLLLERISQSLAGRTAILHLLPLSLAELPPGDAPFERVIFRGRYPRIFDRDIAPTDFYWQSLPGAPQTPAYVVYGGDQSLQTGAGALVSWRELDSVAG